MGMEQVKTKYKEKKNADPVRQYRIFCVLFLAACCVFLSSKLWLPNTQAVMQSEIGAQDSSSSGIILTLNSWQYNPQSGYMEATFAVDKTSGTPELTFHPVAYSIRYQDAPLKCSVAYSNSASLVIRLEDLPKDWEILSLWISDDSEQKFMEGQDVLPGEDVSQADGFLFSDSSGRSGANFKCDARKVQQNMALKPQTEKEYRIQAVKDEIDGNRKKIEEESNTISKNMAQISKLQAELEAVKKEQEYQTENEIRDSNMVIQQKQKEIESLKEKNVSLQENILVLSEKIKKLNLKIDAIKAEK